MSSLHNKVISLKFWGKFKGSLRESQGVQHIFLCLWRQNKPPVKWPSSQLTHSAWASCAHISSRGQTDIPNICWEEYLTWIKLTYAEKVKFQLKKKGEKAQYFRAGGTCISLRNTVTLLPSLHRCILNRALRAQVSFPRHTSPAPGLQGNF